MYLREEEGSMGKKGGRKGCRYETEGCKSGEEKSERTGSTEPPRSPLPLSSPPGVSRRTHETRVLTAKPNLQLEIDIEIVIEIAISIAGDQWRVARGRCWHRLVGASRTLTHPLAATHRSRYRHRHWC